MTIRLEVARSRSYYWPWFLRRAEQAAAHRVEQSSGLEVHIVEVADAAQAMTLWHVIRTWRGVAAYVNGAVVSPQRFAQLMWRAERRPERTAEMLRGILERKAQERDGPQP